MAQQDREARRRLVIAVRIAEADVEDGRARWQERGMASAPPRYESDPRILAARAALAAFDASHPEVLAAIRAEKAARIAAGTWN